MFAFREKRRCLMKNDSRSVVARMIEAFLKKDHAAAISTVSEDSVWIHHGTQKLPSMRFEGRAAVEKFFHTSFTDMDFAFYRPTRFIESGDHIAVLGEESFTFRGETMNNKWVQVYTVVDGLITRMEEFATSTEAGEYVTIR